MYFSSVGWVNPVPAPLIMFIKQQLHVYVYTIVYNTFGPVNKLLCCKLAHLQHEQVARLCWLGK